MLAVVLNYIFPGSFFSTYYTGFPFMAVSFLYVFSMMLSLSYMNVALSMGARRKSMIFAVHIAILIATILAMLISLIFYYIQFYPPFSTLDSPYLFNIDSAGIWAVFMIVAQIMGIGIGAASVDNRKLGILLTVISMLLLMSSLMFSIVNSYFEHFNLWGNLIHVLTVVLTCSAVGSEVYFLHYMKSVTVR
ncbi:MAG: hypothetical protein AB7D36_06460, partial [Oscillospiraceae bacterium]